MARTSGRSPLPVPPGRAACSATAIVLFFATLALAVPPAGAGDLQFVFPGLQRLGAPAWAREGTRLTYSAITATVGGGPDSVGVAGESLVQVDIVAVEGSTVALQTRFLTASGGTWVPTPATSSVEPASHAGEWWVHPAALATGSVPRNVESAIMTRMPYSAAGKTWNALRLERKTEAGTSVQVFDLETGMLVHAGVSARTGDGRVQRSHLTLNSVRTLELPWASLPPNPLQGSFRGFAAQGTYSVSVANDRPIVLGITATAVLLRRGARWMEYRQNSRLHSSGVSSPLPDLATVVCGPAQAGGLFLPEGAAASLVDGMVLDTDAESGARLRIVRRDANETVVQEDFPAASIRWIYDRRGFCVRMVSETRGFTAIRIDLTIRDER